MSDALKASEATGESVCGPNPGLQDVNTPHVARPHPAGRMLTRREVRAAIRFDRPPRPPCAEVLWHNEETLTWFGPAFTQLLQDYPDDVLTIHLGIQYWEAPPDDPDYRWALRDQQPPVGAIDNCPVLESWDQLDEFLRQLPNPRRPQAFEPVARARQQYPERYLLVSWGHYFHQRLAYLRGIEALLLDFYDHEKELRCLLDALLEFYAVWARRSRQAGADGVCAGEDLGAQHGLFFSPDIFRKIYKPYYQALADLLHAEGLDFWMHSCGEITELLDDLIDAGIDVLHPIQAGVMDPAQTLARTRGRLALWVGMDVQQLIPSGTPDEVRAGIRRHAQAFYSPEGGVIYGAGNALMAGIPWENVRTYVETLWAFCLEKNLEPHPSTPVRTTTTSSAAENTP